MGLDTWGSNVGPQIGSQTGAQIGGAAAGTVASWTTDATSGKAVPASALEWSAFIGAKALNIAVPDALWLFQEASGNFADSIAGTFPLTAGASLGHQQPAFGWSRLGVTFTDGSSTSNASTSSASLPDLSVASCTMLGIWNISTPSAQHGFFQMGAAADTAACITATPRMRVIQGSTVTGTLDPTASFRPFLMKSDNTNTVTALYNNLETLKPTHSGATGRLVRFGGSGSVATSVGGTLVYGCMWNNAHAEIADADVTALFTAMGF